MNKIISGIGLLLFLVLSPAAIGNMAQPQYLEQFKTIPGNPFTSRFVDITSEELDIKIHPDFEYATFHINYNIYSTRDGRQIPLLFIASDYASDFTVKLDGVEIDLMPLPEELAAIDESPFSDFVSLFGKGDNPAYHATEQIDLDFYVTPADLLYFETDIGRGAHIIEVSYKASPFVSQSGYVNQYSFRYALSPALYWKSFGTLYLTIDASEFEGTLEINLDKPLSGSLADVAHWQFDKMPVDVLKITHNPPISRTARLIINLGVARFAFVLGAVLFALHMFWMYSFRKKNPDAKISWPGVVGGFVVPLAVSLAGFIHYFLASLFLGHHAGKLYGAGYFFLAFTYPFMVVIYGLAVWLIDRLFRKYVPARTSK